jgi:E3 ubiquitin-protein ligase UBR4
MDEEEEATVAVPDSPSNLKPALVCNPPDLTPFFLKQYVKGHSNDVLEELPILVSEMALRLPYQIKKVVSQPMIFDTVSKLISDHAES